MPIEDLPKVLMAVADYGYLALFVVLFAEELGVPLPLPGDVLLLFTGYLVGRGVLRFDLSVLTVVLAAFAGASTLYALASRHGRSLLTRYGRYIRLSNARLEPLESRFRRLGPWAMLLARITPGLRIYMSAIAGLGGVPYPRFAAALAPAALAWAVAFIFIGSKVGEQWDELARLFEHHGLRLAAGLLFVAAATWWIRRQIRRRQLQP